MSSTDLIYTSNNIVANAMRSICVGYSFAVIITCGILMNFINRRGAILPIISATFLLGFNVAAIVIDLVKAPCKGRAVSIYVFSYLSQICLEVYQSNKMRILSHRDLIPRILSYSLFAIRAISLIVLLFFYYDITNSLGLCATGYPFYALLAEKLILLFYNIGNLAILYFLFKKDSKEHKTFQMDGIVKVFLFQDGMAFVMAIILDGIFIVIVSFVTTPWIFSMAAGLANGFNLLILHVKYCTGLRSRVSQELGTRQHASPATSGKMVPVSRESSIKTKTNRKQDEEDLKPAQQLRSGSFAVNYHPINRKDSEKAPAPNLELKPEVA
ncbi:hypothetical protein HDU67_007557 [Dinochytrium kinnereticum]|nr:hypothetical protein HDU67_007557 [Dinochytrium kinnereticum]